MQIVSLQNRIYSYLKTAVERPPGNEALDLLLLLLLQWPLLGTVRGQGTGTTSSGPY